MEIQTHVHRCLFDQVFFTSDENSNVLMFGLGNSTEASAHQHGLDHNGFSWHDCYTNSMAVMDSTDKTLPVTCHGLSEVLLLVAHV